MLCRTTTETRSLRFKKRSRSHQITSLFCAIWLWRRRKPERDRPHSMQHPSWRLRVPTILTISTSRAQPCSRKIRPPRVRFWKNMLPCGPTMLRLGWDWEWLMCSSRSIRRPAGLWSIPSVSILKSPKRNTNSEWWRRMRAAQPRPSSISSER